MIGLVDVDKKGYINKAEFCVFLHLFSVFTNKRLDEKLLPVELPESLKKTIKYLYKKYIKEITFNNS